jgi:hypothetical protein
VPSREHGRAATKDDEVTLTPAERQVHRALISAVPRDDGAPSARPVPEAPDDIGLTVRPSALGELLGRRHSSRDLTGPLRRDDLGRLLGPLAGERGGLRFATTGGLQALRVLCLLTRVTDVPAGAYWFVPERLTLSPAGVSAAAVANFAAHSSRYLGLDPARPPSALIIAVADWALLGAAYHGSTLAGSYVDAGALLAHLYLSCTEARLNGCACAALDDGALIAALGLDPDTSGHIATFAVGSESA